MDIGASVAVYQKHEDSFGKTKSVGISSGTDEKDENYVPLVGEP